VIFDNIPNQDVKVQITVPGKIEDSTIVFGDSKIQKVVVKDSNNLPLISFDEDQLIRHHITGDVKILLKE
jgi:hypothetical protein